MDSFWMTTLNYKTYACLVHVSQGAAMACETIVRDLFTDKNRHIYND